MILKKQQRFDANVDEEMEENMIKILIPFWMFPLCYLIFKFVIAVILQKYVLATKVDPLRYFMFHFSFEPETSIFKICILPFLYLYVLTIHRNMDFIKVKAVLPEIIQKYDDYKNQEEKLKKEALKRLN